MLNHEFRDCSMIQVLMHYNDFDLSTTSIHRRQNNVKTNIPLQKGYECIYFTFERVKRGK